MTFRLDTSQEVTIGGEAGEAIVTGGTYTGAASDVVNAEGVPVEGGVTYALIAPVAAGAVGDGISWSVEVTADGDVWTELDGFGEDGTQRPTDEVTGAGVSVRYWTPRRTGTAVFTIVRTGNPTVVAPRVAPMSGALIVAGTPRGARVEVTSDGLHAYDSTGAETATIKGDGGEFVGGAYRTTAGTAGRVTMSDSAAGGNPGIEIEPMVTTGYARFPSIMPSTDGMSIAGGVGTDGSQAGAVAKHSYSSLYHNGAGSTGSGSWAEVTPTEVKLTYRGDRSQTAKQSRLQAQAGQAQMIAQLSATAYSAITTTQNGSELYTTDGAGTVARSTADTSVSRLFFQTPTVSGQVRVDQSETYLQRTSGGVTRYLTVDDTGVWVKTNVGGAWQWSNLELTANDTGWVPITLASGIMGTGDPAYRIKGGVVYFRGTVTRSTAWTAAGWSSVATGLPEAVRPAATVLRNGASSVAAKMLLQMTTAGTFETYMDSAYAGSTTVQLSPMFYPLG